MKEKVFSLLILLFAGVISLSSCSSDNDDVSAGNLKDAIVGVWEATHIKGHYRDENENDITVDRDVTEKERGRFQFLTNGGCKLFEKNSIGWYDTLLSKGTYSVMANSISIYSGAELYGTLTVESLTKHTVMFKYYLENSKVPTYLTLKRVE